MYCLTLILNCLLQVLRYFEKASNNFPCLFVRFEFLSLCVYNPLHCRCTVWFLGPISSVSCQGWHLDKCITRYVVLIYPQWEQCRQLVYICVLDSSFFNSCLLIVYVSILCTFVRLFSECYLFRYLVNHWHQCNKHLSDVYFTPIIKTSIYCRKVTLNRL